MTPFRVDFSSSNDTFCLKILMIFHHSGSGVLLATTISRSLIYDGYFSGFIMIIMMVIFRKSWYQWYSFMDSWARNHRWAWFDHVFFPSNLWREPVHGWHGSKLGYWTWVPSLTELSFFFGYVAEFFNIHIFLVSPFWRLCGLCWWLLDTWPILEYLGRLWSAVKELKLHCETCHILSSIVSAIASGLISEWILTSGNLGPGTTQGTPRCGFPES